MTRPPPSPQGRFGLARRDLLLAGAGAAAFGLAGPAFAQGRSAPRRLGPGRAQSLDVDWRFQRGDAGRPWDGRSDDAAWRRIDLPHDWNIEDLPPRPEDPLRIIGPFDRDTPGGNLSGFIPGGEGWYHRRLDLSPALPGRVNLRFEGAFKDCDVWLNGVPVGAHTSGYTPFALDLTPHLSPSGENALSVRIRCLGYNSRWYSGAGLYRRVWIDILPEAARFAEWGTGVVTRSLDDDGAMLEIATRIEDAPDGLRLISRIVDATGHTVWENATPARATVMQRAALPDPALWSPETPVLYSLVSELRRGRRVLDRTETPFGVRIVAFDPDLGLMLNGQPTKLRGGCLHHDHGILGAAAFDAAETRKLKRLKARGFNAVRPSHNLFSPAFLAACDRIGMLAICEIFDVWDVEKFSPEDASSTFQANWKADVDAVVSSARNHPSIIMWSIGNEIPGRNTPQGVETQWRLANRVHELDPTRPVTAALNGYAGHTVTPAPQSLRPGAPLAADRTSSVFLDVVGYNYKLVDYMNDHAAFPTRVIYGSESFPKDVFRIWDLAETSPWLIGDFVWTAIDYLGEVGIGGSAVVPLTGGNPADIFAGWPWINAFCGDLDLIGEQKPASFARDVVWGVSDLEMAVQRPLPEGKAEKIRYWGWSDERQSWSWDGFEDRTMAVRIYTRGDRIELWLNGRLIEARDVDGPLGPQAFRVEFQPGTLEAVAFRNGAELARRRLETTGPAAAIRLTAEPFAGGSDRGDIVYVAVEVVDSRGRVLPDAELPVALSVDGAGELIAFGSANPVAAGGYQSPRSRTWRGRALAVLRGTGRAGEVVVQASGPSIQSERLTLTLT